MFANGVLFLVLLACGAEFGTTYEIFPFSFPNADVTIQKDEIIDGMKNEISAIHSPEDAPVHYDSNVPDLVPPFPEEDKLNSNSMYPMGSLHHPFLYEGAHMDDLQQFPSLDVDDYPAEPFRADFSYTHYQPPPHAFPSVDDSFEVDEIRYVPLIPDEMEFNKPAGPSGSTQEPPTNTLPPIPYLSMTTSSTVAPLSRIEEDMVKRIVQIVDEFRKSNITQPGETEFREKPAESSTLDTEPVRFTVTEANDETVKEFDDSKNRTEIGKVEQIDPDQNLDVTTVSPATRLTVKPFRYVVSQFIDSHGNPCAKEFVMTSTRKSYYVYTCEEKSVPVPRATTSPSSVVNYKDELQTTESDVSSSSQDAVTNPMTAEDQTLPQMLNDYMVYNKE